METKEAIESQIADLRRQRGYALLHGKKFNDDLIVSAQRRLDALTDLESAKASQADEQSTAQREAEIKAAKTEVADLQSASAKALSDSRAGYEKGAANMRLHLQTEASLRKAMARLNSLTGEKTPIMSEPELHGKRALQIAAVGIKPITNHPSYFGSQSGKLNYPNTLKEWSD
jgi:HSP90 family molecular chaperone